MSIGWKGGKTKRRPRYDGESGVIKTNGAEDRFLLECSKVMILGPGSTAGAARRPKGAENHESTGNGSIGLHRGSDDQAPSGSGS